MQLENFGVNNTIFTEVVFFFNKIHSNLKNLRPIKSISDMGAPHTSVLLKCIGEASRYGRKAMPSTKCCERSERLELLFNIQKII